MDSTTPDAGATSPTSTATTPATTTPSPASPYSTAPQQPDEGDGSGGGGASPGDGTGGARPPGETPGRDPGSGGVRPPGDDSAENDTPPPSGSPEERYEQYCNENPGACE